MRDVYQIRLRYPDQTDPHEADIDANDILLPQDEVAFWNEVLGTPGQQTPEAPDLSDGPAT